MRCWKSREFRAQTLATDPEDFKNFETFSMAMVDLDYDGDVFRLGRVFWARGDLVEGRPADSDERPKRLLRCAIPEQDFTGKQMMVILATATGTKKTAGRFAERRKRIQMSLQFRIADQVLRVDDAATRRRRWSTNTTRS